MHERERKQEVRPRTRTERLSHNTPGISPIERGTGGRGLRGLGGRGAFLGRPTERDDGQSAEDTHHKTANTPVYDAATSWFGPLKIVLSAVYASYKVRLQITSITSFLTNSFTGNRFHWEQGRSTPIAYR